VRTRAADDLVLKLIEPKLVGFSEVVVCFFENCNLNCTFCPQDHRSILGMSKREILEKLPLIERFISTQSSKEIHLHLMGGELFQDHLIERGFLEYYAEFVARLRSKFEPEKSLTFNFITNLTLSRVEDLRRFCLELDLKLSISYDPSGRFTPESRTLFEENVETFKDHVRMVSCVITRPNIERAMAGDSLLDRLYNHFPVDWDPLIPARDNSQQLLPKDSELLQFYKFLLERYPSSINLENFVNPNSHQKMRCTRGKSLTIMPDNLIPQGCSGALFLRDSSVRDPASNRIIERFLAKHDCLACPYYSRCSFTCFIAQEYKHRIDDLPRCVFREVFEHLDAQCVQLKN
jgi:hypothetical protein